MADIYHPAPAPTVPPICQHCGTNVAVVVRAVIKGDHESPYWFCVRCDQPLWEIRA